MAGRYRRGCIVMNRRNLQNTLVLSGILLVTGCDATPGGNTDMDSASDSIEMLEQHLEIERHARMVSLKSDPVSSQAEFATDGCSGGLTIGWESLAGKIASFQQQHGTQPAWENCCVEHDRRCHTGGPGKVSASESFCIALGFHKGGRQSCPETMIST